MFLQLRLLPELAGCGHHTAWKDWMRAHQSAPEPETCARLAAAGEWCVAENVYEDLGALNRTQFDTLAGGLAARTGPACNRLDAVTCFRTRKSLGKAWDSFSLSAAGAAARAPAPVAAQDGFQPLATFASAGAPQPALRSGLAAGATAVGGRRRLRQA